jgi:anhydro-N-acetylmuramic acid kinase
VLTIGLMSGTSMDAVDVAVVEFAEDGCDLIHYQQFPIPNSLQSALKSVDPRTPLGQMMDLDAGVGALFAVCANEAIQTCGLDAAKIGVIGSHGQTLLHSPQPAARNSLQVGDANRIAWATQIRTVSDFRRMDMAAGGQGAPLAPAFHAWRFRAPQITRVVINIGGIANISILPPRGKNAVSGFDTGPGNTLLDQWIQRHEGMQLDQNGAWAAAGSPNAELLATLESDPYFGTAPPKSTGRDLFNLEWLEKRAGAVLNTLRPADVQATLLELTVGSIADAVKTHAQGVDEAFVCGGGAHNRRLMARLSDLMAPVGVGSTEDLGIPPDAVEAMMIAWLAWCRVEGIPANLPSVTGAERPVLMGAIYEPGNP